MDQFIGAYKDAVMQNYVNFKGRLGLGGFWRFVLVNFVIAMVLALLAVVIHPIFFILYVGYVLAMLLPGLGASVRRLHDTGKSGWFVFISLVPLVGGIILIVLLAQKGQEASNAYSAPAIA